MFVDPIGHTRDIRVVEYSPGMDVTSSARARTAPRAYGSADTRSSRDSAQGNQSKRLGGPVSAGWPVPVTVRPRKDGGIFDAETGRQLLTLQARATYFEDAHYSPNGRYGTWSPLRARAGTARIFDSTTGRLFLEFGNQGAEISRVAYQSPDGLRIVTASKRTRLPCL